MSSFKDDDVPPSYGDASDGTIEQILGPGTLHIDGRFVLSNDPNAPPLYELSHSIEFLSDSDRTVRFERLDNLIREVDGIPQLTTRKRHLFDLKNPTPAEYPNFEFQAEAVTRRTLCSFGINTHKKFLSGKEYQFHRAVKGSDRRFAPREQLFSVTKAKDKAVDFEWKDAQGRLVAREVRRNETLSLLIGTEMGVALRDALVASWIVRLWRESAKENVREGRRETSKFRD